MSTSFFYRVQVVDLICGASTFRDSCWTKLNQPSEATMIVTAAVAEVAAVPREGTTTAQASRADQSAPSDAPAGER